MIGRLHGTLIVKRPPELLVDVHGVGYELEAPLSAFYDLPETGREVTLLTHLVVREDAHVLYGFTRERDRTLFRSLIRVSGVGAKLALGVLSGMNADEFARCVEDEDVAALVRLPGVGRKTAERLVVEMRDRLEPRATAAPVPAELAPAGDPRDEAARALVGLGYKPAEANRMLRAVTDEGLSVEELLREALKRALKK